MPWLGRGHRPQLPPNSLEQAGPSQKLSTSLSGVVYRILVVSLKFCRSVTTLYLLVMASSGRMAKQDGFCNEG